MTCLEESQTEPVEKHLEFFKLSHNPFPVAPDNTDFFMSRHNESIINKLTREILFRKGFMLLTGDVGVGKTTLSRQIIRVLEEHKVETSLILQSFFQETGLLKEIIKDFGLATEEIRADLPVLMDLLNHFLLKKNKEGINCAILIDDAQNLSIESLELIRMISNLEADREKLVQILLVGQPELLEKLDCRELRQLKSRVTIRQNHVPLEKTEIGNYIQFKLNRAGDFGRITLSPKTLKKLYQLTLGNLRRINILMDRALCLAFDDATSIITPGHIKKADKEISFETPSWKNSILKPSFVILLLILMILGMAGGSILFLHYSVKKEPDKIEKPVPAAELPAMETITPIDQKPDAIASAPQNTLLKEKGPDSVTAFLSAYGLESFSVEFQKALNQKNINDIRDMIFHQTGFSLLRLSFVPEEAKNGFDILSRVEKDSSKTEYFLFWKPVVTITQFYSGFKGEEISRLQRLLFEAEFYDYNIDGIVGQIMMKSIKEFQMENHLPATGFPDPETVFLLANIDGKRP